MSGALAFASENGLKSFGALRRDKGIEFVQSTLAIWIAGLNEFIYGNDKDKALTEFQIEQTADMLSDKFEFSNINIADLSLVFKKAYAGDYGKLYGRLRPDIIIGWFVEYFNERCNAADDINYKKHLQSKNFMSHVPRSSDGVSLRDSIKEAVDWQKNEQTMAETKQRIDKAKEDFNRKENEKQQ